MIPATPASFGISSSAPSPVCSGFHGAGDPRSSGSCSGRAISRCCSALPLSATRSAAFSARCSVARSTRQRAPIRRYGCFPSGSAWRRRSSNLPIEEKPRPLRLLRPSRAPKALERIQGSTSMSMFKAIRIDKDDSLSRDARTVRRQGPDGWRRHGRGLAFDGQLQGQPRHYRQVAGRAPFPMIPGIDFSGVVTGLDQPSFKTGDKGDPQRLRRRRNAPRRLRAEARVRETGSVRLPDGLSAAEAMAIGTAGYGDALRRWRSKARPDAGARSRGGHGRAAGGVGFGGRRAAGETRMACDRVDRPRVGSRLPERASAPPRSSIALNFRARQAAGEGTLGGRRRQRRLATRSPMCSRRQNMRARSPPAASLKWTCRPPSPVHSAWRRPARRRTA